MSSNLITYLLAAITVITMVLVTFGFPALAIVVVRYFKLKERELAFEMEFRHKSEQQQFAVEERVQRLEEALATLERDVRLRLGLDESATVVPPDAQLSEGRTAPEAPGAHSRGD
jgi:hypothetical protein